MLDLIIMLLILFNIILMLYAISERNIAFCFVSAILWLIIAVFMLQGIEIPYEMYNATSGNIETGVHTIRTNLDALSYLFMLFGLIMFILFVTFLLEFFMDYKKIKSR